jgi:hypothetical protein
MDIQLHAVQPRLRRSSSGGAWLSHFGEACVHSQNSGDGQQLSGTELCQPSSIEADKKFSG